MVKQYCAFTLSQFNKAFFSWKAGDKSSPFSKYTPNLSDYLFELFLKIDAKALSYKGVVEHCFRGYRRKGGKGCTLLYSHAR